MTSAGHMSMMKKAGGGSKYAQQDSLLLWLDGREAIIKKSYNGQELPKEKWIVENWYDKALGKEMNSGGAFFTYNDGSQSSNTWMDTYPLHPTDDGLGVRVTYTQGIYRSTYPDSQYVNVFNHAWCGYNTTELQNMLRGQVGTYEIAAELSYDELVNQKTNLTVFGLTYSSAFRYGLNISWYSSASVIAYRTYFAAKAPATKYQPEDFVPTEKIRFYVAVRRATDTDYSYTTMWVNGRQWCKNLQSSTNAKVTNNSTLNSARGYQLFNLMMDSTNNWTLRPQTIYAIRVNPAVLTDEEIEQNYNIDRKIFKLDEFAV